MKSEVVARVDHCLEFVLYALDFLFCAILENVEITKAETMDHYVVVAVLRSERFGKRQAVEDAPILSATLPEGWGIR